MYAENPEGILIIVGSMNMGYISDIAKKRTYNLFCPKWEPIPLGRSDEKFNFHIILFLQHKSLMRITLAVQTICKKIQIDQNKPR